MAVAFDCYAPRFQTGRNTIGPFQRKFARSVGKAREFRADDTDVDPRTVLHDPAIPVRVDKRASTRSMQSSG